MKGLCWQNEYYYYFYHAGREIHTPCPAGAGRRNRFFFVSLRPAILVVLFVVP